MGDNLVKIRLLYRDEKTIGVWLERYGVEERKGIRSVSGRKWLANENVWTIPYTIAAVERLFDAHRDCAIECDKRLSTEMLFIQEKLGQLSAQVKEIPSKLEISQWGSARRT